MGLDSSLPHFKHDAPKDPAFMLLVHTLARERILKPQETATIKATLMREAWNPAFFRK